MLPRQGAGPALSSAVSCKGQGQLQALCVGGLALLHPCHVIANKGQSSFLNPMPLGLAHPQPPTTRASYCTAWTRCSLLS